MRPITTAPTAVLIAAALALGACGSDDDDGPGTDAPPTATTGGGQDPATVSGPAGETSMPGPDFDPDAPPSSTPGGDTSAVAGLWNASDADAPATDYVDIAPDGLWTRYTLDEDGSNCFEVDGPYTLTLEVEASNEYSLSSEDEGLALVANGDVLTYRLGADGEVENWPRAADNATVGSLGLETQTCAPDDVD